MWKLIYKRGALRKKIYSLSILHIYFHEDAILGICTIVRKILGGTVANRLNYMQRLLADAKLHRFVHRQWCGLWHCNDASLQ